MNAGVWPHLLEQAHGTRLHGKRDDDPHVGLPHFWCRIIGGASDGRQECSLHLGQVFLGQAVNAALQARTKGD